MGSFDGAEVCELAGLHLLNLLCEHFKTRLAFTEMMA